MYGRTIEMTVEAQVDVKDFLENLETDDLVEELKDRLTGDDLKEELGFEDEETVREFLTDSSTEEIASEVYKLVADHDVLKLAEMLTRKVYESREDTRRRTQELLEKCITDKSDADRKVEELENRLAHLESFVEVPSEENIRGSMESVEEAYPHNEFPTDGVGSTI